MAYFYRAANRDQQFLLPVSMLDWLEEGHLAWFILDVVGELDTQALHTLHPNDGVGRPAYDPDMMCGLLLYSYAMGLRSSRRIEASCRTDAAYRVICGGLTPDHSTIARFVVNHEPAISGLFVSGLRVCAAAGLLDLSVLALDGTKIASDAALDQNHDAAWITRQVQALLDATAASETAEAPDAGEPLPLGLDAAGDLASPKGRLGRLQTALAVIQAQDAAHAAKVAEHAKAARDAALNGRKLNGRKPTDPAAALARAQADHAAALVRAEQKTATRAAKVAAAHAAAGRLPGRTPGPDRDVEQAERALTKAQAQADAAPPAERRVVNVTDPDSRIMKTDKGWLQGFNAQAIVDKNQIVLAHAISQNTNDVELFAPMIATLTKTLTQAAITNPLGQLLADAGYWSEANATTQGPERLIATLKDYKQRRAAREAGTTTGPPPHDATPLEAMEHQLRTPEGATAYAQRSHTIEPVFGSHKENHGWRRFRRRGKAAAESEWALMNLTHNLTKLRAYRNTQPATS